MKIPVVKAYCDHEVLRHQWCEGCQFDSAISVVVTAITNAGVSTAIKTACPRCGFGLNQQE